MPAGIFNSGRDDFMRKLHMRLKTVHIFAVAHNLTRAAVTLCNNHAVFGQTGHIIMPLSGKKDISKRGKERIVFSLRCESRLDGTDFPLGAVGIRSAQGFAEKLRAETDADNHFSGFHISADQSLLRFSVEIAALLFCRRRTLITAQNNQHIRLGALWNRLVFPAFRNRYIMSVAISPGKIFSGQHP